MGNYFGTDGVRGIVNQDLTPELSLALGKAGAYYLASKTPEGKRKALVLGRDTRVSGDMIAGALIAGITSVNLDVIDAGIIPTPAVAYLTRKLNAAGGVVISASHNPVEYNGIKFFDARGFKLSSDAEEEVEKIMLNSTKIPSPTGINLGKLETYSRATDDYIEYLTGLFSSLDGMKIVVDCANGAAYRAAPGAYRALGAEVITIFAQPEGETINFGCGSTNPGQLQKMVLKEKAEIGIAHDGDADRVILVDERGEILDGDAIMAICALNMIEKGILPGNSIVTTRYSNWGLKEALAKKQGRVVITEKNGDRYVLEKMRELGLSLGGEKSGHIIFLDYNTTGDGILTALQVLRIMKEKGEPLSRLAGVYRPWPQKLDNIRVANKAWEENRIITAKIKEIEEKLGDEGRIYVRASGTEPVIRLMIEAREGRIIQSLIRELGSLIERELN